MRLKGAGHGVDEKWIQNFQLELERKRPFVDRRMILKVIVMKKHMRLWTEFSCLRIGYCEHDEPLGCIQGMEFLD
jgi:hypothetical protein